MRDKRPENFKNPGRNTSHKKIVVPSGICFVLCALEVFLTDHSSNGSAAGAHGKNQQKLIYVTSDILMNQE